MMEPVAHTIPKLDFENVVEQDAVLDSVNASFGFCFVLSLLQSFSDTHIVATVSQE
jgi:hypothetical protein